MALLLVHSHYSLLTAPCSPRQLCEEALRLGHEHLLLCDLNGLYGFLDFAREARRVGLQAMFGVELMHGSQRLWALARDQEGYRSLCHLVTELQLDEGFCFLEAAREHRVGLSFFCADVDLLRGLAGALPRGDLYVALPPPGVQPREVLVRKPVAKLGRKLPDPLPWPGRRELRELAQELDLPLLAVFSIWYARPEDEISQRLFLASKHGCSFDGLRVTLPAKAHLPDLDTWREAHADCPRAQEHARVLRARCSLEFKGAAPAVFPKYHVASGQQPAEHLRGLAESGMALRYGEAEVEVRARLDHELQVIDSMGFTPYFLVVREIAELARSRGIDYVGRGSAADSLVSYCLGLTDADPIRYRLLFARFLNPARANDRPDIDLDFCWRRRDELLTAVYEHFGEDRVAMIATFNTCGPRSAYAEAAKVMGLPPKEAHRRSRRLPHHQLEQEGRGAFARTVAEIPGFYGVGDSICSDPQREARILAGADQLLGAPRHLGVHPGGIVLTPGPIVDYAPLERAAKGLVVTQYDMHFVEDLGLVKIDLLGNRAITVLQDSLQQLRRQEVEVPDLQTIPEDDAKTSRLLRQGRSLGCFQTESPAVRSLLRQMDADNMDRVIQAIALIRPGPSASGMKDRFIRRLRGIEPVVTAHPILAEVFADTFGVMLYQEDVIRAAMAVGRYSPEDGDRLRRHLGTVVDGDEQHRESFLVAGLRRGLTADAVAEVWGEMARFAGYAFCKAHAVTYGRIAYRCAYMKAQHPAAYLAAMLSNDAGYYDKGVYVEEARRMGIGLLHPCVQVGAREYRAEGPAAIRVGLMDVRRLSAKTQAAIFEARRMGGPFDDLEGFLARSGAGVEETRQLILCGALDALAGTRPELLWRLEVAAKRVGRRAQPELLAGILDPPALSFPQLPEYGDKRRAQLELEILGFCLQAHPMDVLWAGCKQQGVLPLGRIEAMVGRQVLVSGWIVAQRSHRGAEGRKMLFLTLEDGTGILEVVLFPDVYSRLAGLVQGRGPYQVRGRIEAKWGSLSMRAQDLRSFGKKAGVGVAEAPEHSLD